MSSPPIPRFVCDGTRAHISWLSRGQTHAALRVHIRAGVAGEPNSVKRLLAQLPLHEAGPRTPRLAVLAAACRGLNRPLVSASAAMFALALPTFGMGLVDERTLDGLNVWFKPLKFQVSLGIYFLTLAYMIALAGPRFRAGWWGRATVWVALASGLFEIVWITLQAGLGERSHYAQGAFGVVMYALMGVGAVLLSLTPVMAAAGMAVERSNDRVRSILRWGVLTGVPVGIVGTAIVGGMLGESPDHYPPADGSGGARLPFVGWSLTSGDLRIPHFVGMHAMQGLIVCAGLLALIRVRAGAAKGLVLATGAAWLALTFWLIHLAVNDRSPFAPLAPLFG